VTRPTDAAIDWDLLAAGCPVCGAALQWHGETFWCVRCGERRSWTTWWERGRRL
jgi:ribosomal protein S27AE